MLPPVDAVSGYPLPLHLLDICSGLLCPMTGQSWKIIMRHWKLRAQKKPLYLQTLVVPLQETELPNSPSSSCPALRVSSPSLSQPHTSQSRGGRGLRIHYELLVPMEDHPEEQTLEATHTPKLSVG
ncbi:hypothetical protein KIL84_000760 [Mauremys mutica]|uniref:Uncharacterized protein n=1 Tax=Mauremys mutica TaxID=74926 RepID=A0A9D3WZG2_9SAUR|nr:hypothetical protein KIL84_000760 [Mauremys mutica]